MGGILADLKYSARSLLKTPGFSVPALITLMLGIGPNSAIFSVVNAVLLRPLPFEDADRIVAIRNKHRTGTFVNTMPNFIDWRGQNHCFVYMALYDHKDFNLAGNEGPEHVSGAAVSPDFFPLLGVTAMLGRTFRPDEEQPGRTHVAVLSHQLWARRFGSDPHIIGKSLTLDSRDYTVVGVTRPSALFHGWKFEPAAEIWIPEATNLNLYRRDQLIFLALGRLKSGVSLQQAQVEMDTIAMRLEQEYPATNRGWGVLLSPFNELLVGNARPMLRALMSAVVLLLLIACVNVANMLLSRSVEKQHEMGLRMALGASRMLVIRRILMETALLAALSAAGALILARIGIKALLAVSPQAVPRAADIDLDGRVLAFTAGLALLVSFVVGLVPAWRSCVLDLNRILREGSRNLSRSRGIQRVRNIFAASEIALALVLLIGAALVVKSLLRLQEINPGFNPDKTLTMMFSYPESRYPSLVQRDDFLKRAITGIASLPGVEAVGATKVLPLSGMDMGITFRVEGRPVMPDEVPGARCRTITYGYFAAMGIPILAGQDFTEHDKNDSRPVVIISRRMARQFWPHEDPIGKRIMLRFEEDRPRTILGIVEDVRHLGIDTEPEIAMYLPHFQPIALIANARQGFDIMYLAIRSASAPLSLARQVSHEIRQVDSQMAVYQVATMSELVHKSTAPRRLLVYLLSAFAGLALVLAALGVYGVLSYSVAQQSNAFAIRMALGARAADNISLVLGQGVRVIIIGTALGVAAALALSRFVAAMLFGTIATDPWIFAAAALSLALVALVACYVPAWRATTTDPAALLRSQ